MLLFYVRHGEPTYQPDELTPNGKRQAEAVGRRLARYGLDKIFCSTSNRALQTAQPAAELTRREIVKLDWCKEGHAWEEMAVEDDRNPGHRHWCFSIPSVRRKLASPEVLSLGDKWYEAPGLPENRFKDGVERVNREVDAWLEGLGYRHDRANKWYVPAAPTDERIALFAHQGFGNLFFSSVFDIPYPLWATRFDQNYTGVSAIWFQESDGVVIPKMIQFSGDGHLYAADLPTEFNKNRDLSF